MSCPACLSANTEIIHEATGLPTNSCLLVDDIDIALSYPWGEMALSVCLDCGFVYNGAWDGSSQYDSSYEETQTHSATFRAFATDLAQDWVDRFDLAGKSVLEIGCGSAGEFLQMMVDAGAGRVTGIDPALKIDRIDRPDASQFEWLALPYDAGYGSIEHDAVVCRHTLEHIGPVHEFMTEVRRGIGNRTDVAVLFELPDVARVLQDAAFEDVYFEHCSYFSAGSLARLFRLTGFRVTGLRRAYDDQYLLIEAYPAELGAVTGPTLDLEADLDATIIDSRRYQQRLDDVSAHWAARLGEVTARGGKNVIWGGGSKAVAFLTTLGLAGEVSAAVDINPVKQGRYLAGTGHRVIAPKELVDLEPDLVVAMNSIYVPEIRADLDRLGVGAELEGL
ncbi:MAG: methyltransferase domain-containing protein [Actinomycetia bacterium]|nr:methyltransferase domain-containing protein [Actinomycetes bacterium]